MLRSEDYFIVRTPLSHAREEVEFTTTNLRAVFEQPTLREAIFLASPTLHSKLQDLLENSLPPEEKGRVLLSLKKYLLRLSNRCTPFGLFAAISIGRWDPNSSLEIEANLIRHSRLDFEITSRLSTVLQMLPEIAGKIRFFPNDTIYLQGSRLRYVEYFNVERRRVYRLADVEHTEYVAKVLSCAASGLNRHELASALVDEEISFDDATQFVEELVQNKVLLSEFEARLTGIDYFSYICEVVNQFDCEIKQDLFSVKQRLRLLDQHLFEENLPMYQEIQAGIEKITSEKLGPVAVQVDAFRKSTLRINQSVESVVRETILILSGLTSSKRNDVFCEFKRKFFERYEFRPVDLCTALDPETGIGYPVSGKTDLADSALLNMLSFADEKNAAVEPPSEFQSFILRKFSEALRNQSALTLTADELRPFMKPASAMPSSLYAMVTLYSTHLDELDKGNFYIHFSGAYGPSASNAIARFCHLDEELTTLVRETLRKEEQLSDALFAEVVHINQLRVGNISARPVLRHYEIPVLAMGGVDQEYTIPVADLFLVVINGRLSLRSKRLNREIIPRLSSAHNFTDDTISVFRFLCDMQYQEAPATYKWEWGVLKSAHYLPEVRLGNVILSLEQWRLTVDEVETIKKTENLAQAINLLRWKRNLPRWILVGTSDNKIPLDLENPAFYSVFQKMVEPETVLEKCPPSSDWVVRDRQGRSYNHELIIPYVATTQNVVRSDYREVSNQKVKRNFQLGSEWLYYKLYCNPKAADHILGEIIGPFVEQLKNDKLIDKWFFIRYSDPEYHLRLRFHGRNNFYNTIIPRFQSCIASLTDGGFITEACTHTYIRELERYGGEAIAEAESIFHVDSESILQLLQFVQADDNLRWQIGLACADQLLNVFNVTLPDKIKIMGELQQQFFSEMNVNQSMKRSLAEILRENRKTIERVLFKDGLPQPIREILEWRAQQLRPVADTLLRTAAEGTLRVPVEALLKDYTHMTFNRIFSTNPRHFEMVLYDFLFQLYSSQSAKARNSNIHATP